MAGGDLEFEWDAGKAAANLAKQGVTLEEATTAFADPRSFSVPDPRHSHDEPRYAILGRSARGRLLAVFFTDRGPRTRIISAREATRRERAPMSTGPSEGAPERPAGPGPVSPDPADVDPADVGADEILPEYDFRGERGTYAARYAAGTNVVVLDPDVAAVYPTAEAVNAALRALAEVARRQAGRAAA